ncbi:Na+/H+ antiporter NhaC family protein [Kytococcus sedentarius]|uniref:Na+/H+ antiporter NhaC family protein n=1 Tax=Kytococcus sedentarius TaxID=1276 RepID=UPI0035BC3855
MDMIKRRDPGGDSPAVDHSPAPGSGDEPRPGTLELYGGRWAALIPAAVLVIVLAWLSVAERAAVSSFWVGGFLALVVGLLLARDKQQYSEAVTRGLTSGTGAVIIMAFLFAGIFGTLMKSGGLVAGLLWVGDTAGVTGGVFVGLAFLLSCLFAAGTGTSVGTVLALAPVLYPTGLFLGAEPVWLALAIIAGGAFGDNIAPVSDTTITSAFTQDARMGTVVRSRLPLAVTAAAVSLVVLVVMGGGGERVPTQDLAIDADPLGLVMLLPFAVVIGLALMRHHIIVSLTAGILTAVVLGAVTGLMPLSTLFSIPSERGESTGLLEDGISGVTAVVILVLLIMALAQVFAESGLMQSVLEKLRRSAARGVRSAELAIVGISILFTIPLGANAPAILLVGPTIAKPLGESHGLSPQRRANLLDCAVCTVFYMLPWHNAVIVWFATVTGVAAELDLPAPGIGAAFLNPYAWALLVVLLVSVLTGWNRYAGMSRAERAEAEQRHAGGTGAARAA